MKWYLKVLKNYANFSGRARRKEYWNFALFNAIFGVLPYYLGIGLFLNDNNDPLGGILMGVSVVYLLITFIPSLAVTVRRLHDIDKRGTTILVAFIPFIGSLWLLVLLATDGTAGENNYGPDPKAEGASSNPIVS